jgi:electron transfer flavoprotein beta subunit
VAEKLGLPQITYAEEVLEVTTKSVKVRRRLDNGVETVEGALPMLITVNGSAAPCRPRNAYLLQKYKRAVTVTERQEASNDYIELYHDRPYLNIVEMGVKDIDARLEDLGLPGSPTKVKKIENVVFQTKEAKVLGPSDANIEGLMIELLSNHTLG